MVIRKAAIATRGLMPEGGGATVGEKCIVATVNIINVNFLFLKAFAFKYELLYVCY